MPPLTEYDRLVIGKIKAGVEMFDEITKSALNASLGAKTAREKTKVTGATLRLKERGYVNILNRRYSLTKSGPRVCQ